MCLLTSVTLASFSDLRAGLISQESLGPKDYLPSQQSFFATSPFLCVLTVCFVHPRLYPARESTSRSLCLRFLCKPASASFLPLTYPTSSYVYSIFGVYIVLPFHLSIFVSFLPSIDQSIYACCVFRILSCVREISTSVHCLGFILEQSPRVICTV
ncbi:uncharacterized protein BO66DRAFT_118478 [Aspergillus aculeatinus CBS 121060]|uniref:Uncharacterized protein n=1 Tax=Aspergillus aculeatinus CBS 121060 TaxID=1448322 RepID=A0ACD1H632_9EURO|nr:hypothetical protein BO66DRAFT_118478 [Aspergillus aculeatinus CBS 121060]RAH68968.1 hypothetical protein BO66DRAFT_118478 [Aspergillus aculeatinus CBS 121060]